VHLLPPAILPWLLVLLRSRRHCCCGQNGIIVFQFHNGTSIELFLEPFRRLFQRLKVLLGCHFSIFCLLVCCQPCGANMGRNIHTRCPTASRHNPSCLQILAPMVMVVVIVGFPAVPLLKERSTSLTLWTRREDNEPPPFGGLLVHAGANGDSLSSLVAVVAPQKPYSSIAEAPNVTKSTASDKVDVNSCKASST
jgi:hypothetical protein